MYFATLAASVLASASLAAAANFSVLVGANGLTFEPNNITGAVAGDTVEFLFYPKNHTVTQSTFAAPCSPMSSPAAGVDSGFLPVQADATERPAWSFTIQDASAPLWFYCAQGQHCVEGMVFAVNPTEEKSMDMFVAAAKASGDAAAAEGASSAAGGASPAAAGASSAAGGAAGSSTVPPTATAVGGAASAASASTSSSAQAVGAAAAESVQENGARQVLARAATPLLAVGLLAGLIL
ncbi:hypothetical protein BD626DRAFT_50837 [Schizophyllum amplum]|uniref:Cupredoxin n=1 Tax=Schizophyllum amplum TaxID=97359 RepID=A0A550CCK5_9AGAR|nr:hypothetical protein BD626DRAFT_50837 [Auriculariopsis ampla]